MKQVVLGVCGSVAAYRACDLARDLMRSGCNVRVCLTDAAEEFVTPVLFEALTGNPCLISAFDEPERGRMAHIDWARAADLVLVAPCSASTIGKLASGVASDMLSTLVLAYDGPILIAPAMNPTMLTSGAVQSGMQTLRERGMILIEPDSGAVACGEEGQGKLAANDQILGVALAHLQRSQALKGQRVLITSGPTVERIDDVRYISNRSSGKMGAALATAAVQMGAEVTIVTGPVHIAYPARAEVIRVESAAQMLAAASDVALKADWIVGAAAVADYRVENPVSGKIRRTGDDLELKLVQNPDIIASLAQIANPGTRVIGFAAEPSEDTAEAIAKIARKKLAAIVHNDVSRPGLGFESDHNALTLLWADGSQVSCEPISKIQCAQWLWGQLIQ